MYTVTSAPTLMLCKLWLKFLSVAIWTVKPLSSFELSVQASVSDDAVWLVITRFDGAAGGTSGVLTSKTFDGAELPLALEAYTWHW